MPLPGVTPHRHSLVRLRRFGSISYSFIHATRRLLKHLKTLAGPHFNQLPKTTWQRSNYLLTNNHCYGQTDISSVNKARFQIFTSSVSGNLRELPPSRSSLTLHVMRSPYQSGWIWGNSVSEKACPPVAEWGWFCTDGVRIQIEWCKLDAGLELMTLATLVKTCKCKRSDNSCFHANVAIAPSSNLYV